MKRILILIFCFAFNVTLCNLANIAHLAKQVITYACPQAQKALFKELKTTNSKQLTNTNTLILLMHALIQSSCPVAMHGKHIPATYAMLHVPGYLDTLRYIAANPLHESVVKGYSYELERALELMQEGHQILHFQYKLSDGLISRTIDIHTDKCMVECKNMKWPNCFNEYLFNQFCDQQHLVNHYNTTHNTQLQYQVSSKQPISQNWKKWFCQRNINTHESPSQT